jgi:hypothetical protein
MNNRFLVLFALITMFSVNSTFSQGCEGDDATTANDSLAPKTIVFGYLQTQYDYGFTNPDASTFRFKRARIGVRGKVMDDFSYYFMLETSPFIGSTGDAYLMDAFVTWNKHNWSRVSVGSFKQPFSLEVSTACHSLTTIDRSIVADQLVAPQRDFGLMVLGGNKYTKFNYAVALMNGRGLKVKDDNQKKDIVGRLTYKVTDFATIGASFRYGYPIPNNNDDTRTTFGGELLVKLNNFTLQGEYIYDEGAYFSGAAGGCGTTPVELGEKRDGAYAMLTYDTKWKVQPVFKYEYFDPNIDVKDIGYQEMMTLGFNYFFNDKVRLQMNYQAHIETINNVDNDMLLAQLQIKW